MKVADYIGRYWAGAEVMYGIIIAMTFTCMVRTQLAGHGYILDKVIIAALLCCAAWGLADGFFYVWERDYILMRESRIIDAARSGNRDGSLRDLIGEELDDTILRTIPPADRAGLYDHLIRYLSTLDTHESMSPGEAVTIILGTFLLSTGAGLLIVFPFFFTDDIRAALGLSNLLGILLLFSIGYLRSAGRPVSSRFRFGLASSCVGIIIAGMTVVLGG
jgi:VIT1/CCC1 family predicted Fe2+/Mn2+ transporter